MIWRSIVFSAAATLVLSLLGVAHPLGGGVAIAQDDAEYPDYILHELEADQLKRRAELQRLRRELDELSETTVSARIKKFNEVLSLLRTDKELRDMLADSPELYPLYRSVLGDNATVTLEQIQMPSVYADTPEHCACLSLARVRWLGDADQAGQAVLALGGKYYDVQVGDALGGTSCTLREASVQGGVTLECAHPGNGDMMRRIIALQSLPDTRALPRVFNERE